MTHLEEQNLFGERRRLDRRKAAAMNDCNLGWVVWACIATLITHAIWELI